MSTKGCHCTRLCRLCQGEPIAPWPPTIDGGPTHHTCHQECLDDLETARREDKEREYKNKWVEEVRDAALEEAAQVAEGRLRYPGISLNGGESDTDGRIVRPIAKAIRALKSGGTP